jgi:hypothetical protein
MNDSISGVQYYSAEQNAQAPKMRIANKRKTSIIVRVEINSE